MLKKKANLLVRTEETGWRITDPETGSSVMLEDETTLELTSLIWEACDRREARGIVDEIIGEKQATAEERSVLTKVVTHTLAYFVEKGWAEEAGGRDRTGGREAVKKPGEKSPSRAAKPKKPKKPRKPRKKK